LALKRNQKQFLGFLVIPLAMIILVAPVVFLLGYQGAAQLISYGGTSLVITVAVCYVVFFESKKRWPNDKAFDRFAKLITFAK